MTTRFDQLATLLVVGIMCIAQCIAQMGSGATVYYELPRDIEALRSLRGAEDAAAIVVRGTLNSSESSDFVVRTSNRQIGMQVSKWSNADCAGELLYSGTDTFSLTSETQPALCNADASSFAPFSTRSQLQVSLRARPEARTFGTFSFELVFTFYRTYTFSCDALRCSASRWCISAALLCDGVRNCEDGSDEWPQACRNRAAPATSEPRAEASTSLVNENVRLCIAVALALLLVAVAVAIGLCCRRRRRMHSADQYISHLERPHNARDSQRFLGPPDYRTAVRNTGRKGRAEADGESDSPPSYVEALEITSEAQLLKAARPSSMELTVSDAPSTSSSCMDFDSPDEHCELARGRLVVTHIARLYPDAREYCDCSPV